MIESPLDDPERNAPFFWAMTRTALALIFYLTRKASLMDSVADSLRKGRSLHE